MPLRYHSTDNGNCRVYYKEGRHLFAFQEDRPGQFVLYSCSRDGEPSYEIRSDNIQLAGLPQDDSVTARNFRTWKGG